MTVLSRLGLAALMTGSSCAALAENITPNLKFNGFASAAVSVLNDDQGGEYIPDFYGYPGISETANAGLESLIGLQFDYKVNDQVNVVAQLVAQGRNNYDVNAEWAYIGYQINDQLRLRGGRFGLPTFMYSDTIHVGQSYPWARLPVEAYEGVPVTNFNGVDLLYRQPVGDWNLDAQFLLGSSSTDIFRIDNSVGANVSLSNSSLTMRAGIIETRLTMGMDKYAPTYCAGNAPLAPASFCNVSKEKTTFTNAGVLFDDGQWFLAGEVAQLEIHGWLSDWRGGYLSAGYYVGKMLPYVLWSKIDTYSGEDCTPVMPFCSITQNYGEQTTLALGAKYALSNNVSLKSQVDHVSKFNGTRGLMSVASPEPFYVFTLGLTAAF